MKDQAQHPGSSQTWMRPAAMINSVVECPAREARPPAILETDMIVRSEYQVLRGHRRNTQSLKSIFIDEHRGETVSGNK